MGSVEQSMKPMRICGHPFICSNAHWWFAVYSRFSILCFDLVFLGLFSDPIINCSARSLFDQRLPVALELPLCRSTKNPQMSWICKIS
jgi:hypothetical protein